jgi:putative transposase
MLVGWHWRLVRWRPTTVRISLVLDALEQALWTRRRDGSGSLAGSIHHTGAESHCTLIALTGRLAAAGISASVGTLPAGQTRVSAQAALMRPRCS